MSECTIDTIGNKRWRDSNGDLHREDMPAFEGCDGTELWYINGQLHREDGPACEYSSGTKEWYLNDKKYTEKEFKEELAKRDYIPTKPEPIPEYIINDIHDCLIFEDLEDL